MLSASVLLQVLVLPLIGAVADRTGRKREMLAGFAFLGALATTALFFVADGALAAAAPCCSSSPTSASAPRWSSTTRGCPIWPARTSGTPSPAAAGPSATSAAALLLALNLGLLLSAEALGLTEGEAVRICLASAGLWWGAFTVFTRVPAAQPAGPRTSTPCRGRGSGFRQLGATLRELRPTR